MSIQFSAREIRSVIASIEDRLGRVHGVYNMTVDDPPDQKMLRELIERFRHELEELAATPCERRPTT